MSPKISDREEMMAQEKDISQVLEKARDDWTRNTSREVGLGVKQGYFFLTTKGKADYRSLKPFISYLFWGKSLNLLNLIHQIMIITPTRIGLLKEERIHGEWLAQSCCSLLLLLILTQLTAMCPKHNSTRHNILNLIKKTNLQ